MNTANICSRDLSFRNRDGLQLYACEYSKDNSKWQAQAAALCLHGLNRNSADFANLARHLCLSIPVLTADQRGRGRSDYDPNIENYNLGAYCKDMFELLDRQGIERVILIGTSMGGLMAMLMAAMQAERILGIVLNDIGPELAPEGVARIQASAGQAAPAKNWAELVARERARYGETMAHLRAEEWLDFARGSYREQGEQIIPAYDPAIYTAFSEDPRRALPGNPWALLEKSAHIPMLLIRGERSDLLSRSCAKRMASIVNDFRQVEIADCGHAPTLNEAKARTAIDQFLAARIRILQADS